MQPIIHFYHVSDPYGCFSNVSPHPVFLAQTTWPTTTHYFQAQKFEDGQYRFAIQRASSPMIAVRMGHDRRQPLRSDWEQIKDNVMRNALWAKVIQHADVRATLLATSDALLVQHTPNDRYWADGGNGSGKNMLGILWMEVRAQLTKDGPYDELAYPPLPLWLKYPHIPRSSIGWRMGYGEAYVGEWVAWYEGLSANGKRAYQVMYPEPKEWRGYYNADDSAAEE